MKSTSNWAMTAVLCGVVGCRVIPVITGNGTAPPPPPVNNNTEPPFLSCEDGEPTVTLTSVPELRSFEQLRGRTSGVSRTDHRVVAYICVGGQWFVKPFAATPLTTIAANCTFQINITTGGTDQLASEIRVFVVPVDYQAALNTLPSGNVVIAAAPPEVRGESECTE